MREVECLILDHHLPNITGLELAKRLRADGSDMRISADHRLTLSGNIRSGR
jgi:FixJ family two-component response regulator